jgi:thymidine kinase
MSRHLGWLAATRYLNSGGFDFPLSHRASCGRLLNKKGKIMSQAISPGRLEVITGPMFSGKSEELIRRLRRAQIAKRRVLCFKPELDVRYHRTAIASHSSQSLNANIVANVGELREALVPVIGEVEVVGIDDAQFFECSLVRLALELTHLGKRAVVAGLDTTFAGEPFPPIPELLAIADEVVKLSAVCTQCGAPAVHSQRLSASRSLVLVGTAELYEARCRICFRPTIGEHAPEQLELPTGANSRGEYSYLTKN